jgi:hypothetical protein
MRSHAPRTTHAARHTRTQAGGLLVDGLGDGALVEAPHEDLDFLRTTSFGLLQARALAGCVACVRVCHRLCASQMRRVCVCHLLCVSS